jgi:cysteinyl-tRNA synthetase
MLLFDTLSGKKKKFRPLTGNTVRIYTCGPSVYDYSHIGNFRTYLVEDVLVRYLLYRGYKVKRVMNITDVEDKAIKAAKKKGISLKTLVKDKTRVFFADFDELGMLRPDIVANATEHVPQIGKLIQRICKRGFCKKEKDGIYFDVRKFGGYGNLRKLKSRKYLGVMRKDDYSKHGLWDFRLWKFWTKGDGKAVWQSPWGMGRPGWHIECSAIGMHYLGDSFDIHCGGTDNIFPHHDNEIAQSEAASGKKLANFWMHARHLTIGKKKMSKRLGNVYYVKQLQRLDVPPKCLRFYLISEKYRNRHDFTINEFRKRIKGCNRGREIIRKLRQLRAKGSGKVGSGIAEKLLVGFEDAMDNDLNTRLAFNRIFRQFDDIETLMKEKRLSGTDAKEILKAIERIDSVLGVFNRN